MTEEIYDVVVVGGGPSGATAANDLALAGRKVLLLDRAGRIKPCGGAVPPRLMEDYEIPQSLLVARARSARMIAPSNRTVDMPVGEIGYVGMVDRDVFDEWLRERAAKNGAVRRKGTFETIERDDADGPIVCFRTERGDLWELMSAAGVMITVPIFIMALLIQKHFTRGMTAGAVK